MPATPDAAPLALARRLAASYAGLPEVEAVALAGSQASGLAGPGSDVDLYVYAVSEPPLAARAAVAAGGRALELGNAAFEPGDEWIDGPSGVHVDVMFRTPVWIEGELDRVLVRHEARPGYSTALWHSVREAVSLFDRRGWWAALQARAAAPYPEPLRRAVVARNHPLLRGGLSSFRQQLARAAERGDLVAVNHRAAALLASAFDLLFAVNRATHPGEKRLLEHARRSCPRRPPGFEALVERFLAALPGGPVVAAADALCDGIDELLRQEGLHS